MVGLGRLAEVVLGTGPVLEGLRLAPTAPTSLAVRVDPGQIYQQASVDALAFGEMAADTAHAVVKQGLQPDPVTLPLTAPGTPGFAQRFLVQCAYQERDEGAVVLPYYRSDNPSQPWSGPGNSGEAQYTQRNGRIVVQVKAGAPAAAGSEQVPSADPGWTALGSVSVSNGQAAVLAQHIANLATVPRVRVRLPEISRAAGLKTTVVTGPTTLDADAIGLVIVDFGPFPTGSSDVVLPPANALGAGVSFEMTFIGKYLTPRGARRPVPPLAAFRPRPGDRLDRGGGPLATFDDSGFGISSNDKMVMYADGVNTWHAVAADHTRTAGWVNGVPITVPSGVWTVPVYAPTASTRWWLASDNATAVLEVEGRYHVGGWAYFPGTGLGGDRALRLTQNGAPWSSLIQNWVPAGAGFTTLGVGPALLYGMAGDQIQLQLQQTSGAPIVIPGLSIFLEVCLVC